LAQKNVTILDYSYSSDLSSSDYFLFPKIKLKLKGWHFDEIIDIQSAVTDQLKFIMKEDFSTVIKDLKTRVETLYSIKKDYFE